MLDSLVVPATILHTYYVSLNNLNNNLYNHHHSHNQLDKLNPQVASRVVRAFDSWKQYDGRRKELMQAQLQRVLAQEGLSANVYEIASKSAAF